MSGVELTTSGRVLDLLMYADDIVLISSSATGLKNHLHTLQSFCKDWKLNVNTDKTKVCVFGRDRGCQPFLWNGTILEKIKSYRYLGTWISKNGKFGMARKHLANQVKKAAFALIAIDNEEIESSSNSSYA